MGLALGAENGDSQLNMNYSWPFLFWYGQPFFHTGFRVSAAVAKQLQVTAFVANGWNNTMDNNGGKTYGAQLPSPRATRCKSWSAT